MSRKGPSGMSNNTVPYDEWGQDILMQDVYDKDGNVIGHISDEMRWVSEPDVRPTTKKEVLSDIDGWRNDDGTYGDEDTAIYLAYKDGSFVDVSELNGKAYKKSGIVGASISTGDYEMVWGGEMHNGVLRPWKTWSPDGEGGASNSYSGYKTTGVWKERVKTTYNNPNGRGGYKVVHKTIRKSTIKGVR